MKKKKQQYRIRNWREYNAALVERGSLTFWFDEEVIQSWHPQGRSGRRGRPVTYADVAIQCMLILKGMFHLPLRATEGLFKSVVEGLGLELLVPDYTTVCRRQQRLEVSLPRVSRGEPLHVVVDSTGLKVFGEGCTLQGRMEGTATGVVKATDAGASLHFGVDEASGQIVAAAVTTNTVSDGELLPELLNQVEAPIEQVSADGAYDTREVYEVLSVRGARAAIPPRKGAKIWQHGNSGRPPHARDENLRRIRHRGRKQWKKNAVIIGAASQKPPCSASRPSLAMP
jgi:Transposase DDE domain.